ncbi:hypothetical protein ACHAXS_008648 [Conticribra weissflogii]
MSPLEDTSDVAAPSLATGAPLSVDDRDEHDADDDHFHRKAPTPPSSFTSLASSSERSNDNDDKRNDPTANDANTSLPAGLPTAILSSLRRHKANLTLAELSGSLGDLGTFIPLTVALARERKIALAPALFWAGVGNVVTGMAWDVPMCVQPMKSISAVALSGDGGDGGAGLDARSVTAAGMLAGGMVLVLGATNLMEVVNWVVPTAVVCGLQVGVGLRLAAKGMKDVQSLGGTGVYDSIGLAIACSVLCMYWLRARESGHREQVAAQERQGNEDAECGVDCRQTYGSICNASSCPRQIRNDTIELGNLHDGHDDNGNAVDNTTDIVTAGSTSNQQQQQQQQQQPHILRKLLRPLSTCLHCLRPNPTTPHPVGIYLFLLGSLFAAITLATAPPSSTRYDLPLHFFGAPIVINALSGITPLDWRQGFFQGALPQLPLTCLNSVISVCCLAHNLYPEKRRPSLEARGRTDAVVTRRDVAVSVGLMNLALCPLGSMPNCHGAGGLAGQHRFGARHGTSVVALGAMKMLLAVFFGGSALTLLDALPVSVLGVMIGIAGLELVGTGVAMLKECVEGEVGRNEMDESTLVRGNAKVNPKAVLRKISLIAMVTASVIVALEKTHYGVVAGWVVHMIHGDGFTDLVKWFRTRRGRRREDAREE